MLVLAIDTSGKIGTVAIFDSKEGTLCEITVKVKKNHSDTIMETIDSLFKFSEYTLDNVELIAVTTGPGSFTGIRIGMATAKGIAIAKKIPIVGINTLEALAYGVSNTDKTIISFIDAKKERVYYGVFKYINGKLQLIEEYSDSHIDNILDRYKYDKIIFTGDGAFAYKDKITSIMGENGYFNNISSINLRGSCVAEAGMYKNVDNVYTLEPFYISKTQAEQNKLDKTINNDEGELKI